MMTTRKVWITADPYGGLTDGEAAAASAAGAGEILHGIPPVLADLIPAGTVGLVEMAEPEPEAATPDPDRYVAAEQARRTAYDAVMAGGTRTLDRIDLANNAGSDAFLAALEAP